MKRKPSIHHTIKTTLGYPADEPDKEVLKDWKARTSRVCKPCWELKYCPYGPLVEQSPLLPAERAEIIEHNEYLKQVLTTGFIGTVRKITKEDKKTFENMLNDEKLLLRRAIHKVRDQLRIEECSQSANPVAAFWGEFGGILPPIEKYRVPFEPNLDADVDLEALPASIRVRVSGAVKEDRARLQAALKTGILDDRRPLDDVRRASFEKELQDFSPEDHPEQIPQSFNEASCNIFGHICPVFFAAEAFTETTAVRRRGRYIPFKTKIRVVRRDNYTCQHCGIHIRDDEVEFDHIIPVSKGGSSEEHNLRLTCFDCNRDKSDDVAV